MENENKLEILFSFNCNVNCEFCSFGHKDRRKEKPLDDIREEIRKGRKEKIDYISFTGGEPTIRKELTPMIKYAKDLGFKNIEIQSNGRMLSYRSFCKKLIKAGVNHWIISLHGNKKLHDELTRTKGSFEEAVEGVKNLKILNQPVHVNTVIVKRNYKKLPEITKMLSDLNVDRIHYLFVNPDGYSRYNKKVIPKMSNTSEYLKKAIDEALKTNMDVGVFYMPFCVLEKEERKDYKKYIRSFGSVELRGPDLDVDLSERREKQNVKFNECKKCTYNDKCYGVRKEYVELYGSNEFRPVGD